MRVSRYERAWEVWRELKQPLRFSRALSSRVHPWLDIRTLGMDQLFSVRSPPPPKFISEYLH